MPIPPDTRAPGDAGHVADHNNIADELTALTAADATETARGLAAEALLAPKASPALTGTPTAPTATALTGTTQVATTAYADSAVAVEASRAAAAEALKAPLASPALTGNPTAPTQAAANNSTRLATTAYADGAVATEAAARATAVSGEASTRATADALLAPLASPALTGNPTAPTQTAGDSSTKLATTAFVATAAARVFSPMAYGAAGNGVTDDTTAVLAAFTAASTAKGIVDLGTGTYLTSSAIPAYTGMRVRGSNQQGLAAAGGTLTNSTSDLFSFTGTISDIKISDCTLKASAGHVFAAGTATLAQIRIEGVTISQTATGKSIWNQTGGAFIDCLIGDNSSLIASPAATVSPWTMTGMAGVVNSVAFRRMRCTMNGTGANVPFFKIDPGSTAGWNQEIKFEHITWEVCSGGGIYMTGCVDVTIDTCSNWDIASAGLLANFYSFKQSTAGYPSRSVQVRGGRAGGLSTAGSGFSDFFADSNSTNILLDSFGSWGTAPVISSPANQTTVINGTVASGSPTNTIPGLVASQDPLGIGVPVNFFPSTLPIADGVVTANDGWYSKLISGGYAMSNIVIIVAVSSGNISVAAYTNSGTGMSAAPTGGRLATSGAVACPAAGAATVALGSSVSPALGDWLAISADNTTATFYRQDSGVGAGYSNLPGWGSFQTTAHPLPSTPSGLGVTSSRGNFVMRGS